MNVRFWSKPKITRIMISAFEVVDSNLSLVEMLKMRGVPCVYSLYEKTWSVDFNRVKVIRHWENVKNNQYIFEWEAK